MSKSISTSYSVWIAIALCILMHVPQCLSFSVQKPLPNSNNNSNNSNELSEQIISAAAEMTSSTSSLLGIKSVGVDYGLVRTGTAVSNGYNPQPLSILSHHNQTTLSSHILQLVQSEAASQVVMGLPFHKNGTEAEQTTITRSFASFLNCQLCAYFGYGAIPVYLWDERYTSKEAESRIRANNPNAGLLYKDLDADAASIILEYYYAENGDGAELVLLPEDEKVRQAVDLAWEMRKEERRRDLDLLMERRMNAGNRKKELIEKAKLLDAKLEASSGSNAKKKGKKKKKKKKRQWIHLSPGAMETAATNNNNAADS